MTVQKLKKLIDGISPDAILVTRIGTNPDGSPIYGEILNVVKMKSSKGAVVLEKVWGEGSGNEKPADLAPDVIELKAGFN